MERTDQPNPQPSPRATSPQERSLRNVAVIGTDRPGAEPMTDAERQQWAALEESFFATLHSSRANAAARCGCQAVHA